MNSIWKPFIIPLFIDSHNLHYGISEMEFASKSQLPKASSVNYRTSGCDASLFG